MEWTRSGDDLFVRLDPGEEIHSSLRALADEAEFDAAAITSGIGRTRNNLYGYMSDDHIYTRRSFEPSAELVSLQGNLARLEDGTAFTHIHATWCSDDNVVMAGHMFESTIHVVGEIHMRVLSESIMTRCPMENSEFIALRFS
jgi:predicted DNA-binding protein with PD1-like motif